MIFATMIALAATALRIAAALPGSILHAFLSAGAGHGVTSRGHG
jgi:hypothetical protein